MKEIKSLRKRNEKHFLNLDGSITAYLYNQDVHYLKDGKYEDIDNTLVDGGNYIVNQTNSFHTFFRKKQDNKLIVDIEKENHYLKIYLNQKKFEHIKFHTNNNKFEFQDILKDIDFRYQVLSASLKESIILKNKNSIPKFLSFVIVTDLTLRIENRKIEARDKNKNVIFIIDAPFMMDANNEYNYNIHYSLKLRENGYLLTLKLDNEWLDNAEFPVIIDPTIINNDSSKIYDTYIYSQDNNISYQYDNEILKIGIDPNDNTKIYETLMKFDLPTIGTGCDVISAKGYLVSHSSDTSSNDNNNYIYVHAVNQNWNESQPSFSSLANAYESRVEDFFIPARSTLEGTQVTLYTSQFDITNLVKRWYAGKPNYGVLLKTDLIPANCKEYTFYSKDNTLNLTTNPTPFLVVTYRNQNGLEDYMSYQKQNFVDGTAYINNLTGNLTTVFSLNKTIGGKYPIELSLIYNTNDVVLNNNIGYGLGYRFNLHETIEPVVIDDKSCLEYIDADGTLHYFTYDIDDNGDDITTEFVDEDGLGLTAKLTNQEYIITDKDGNQSIFTKNGDLFYLTKLIDTNENQVIINYDSNYRINKITDANQSEINIVYTADQIVVSSDYAITTINYLNNQVSNIITKNGITIFQYDTRSIIVNITDITGLSYEYEYYNVSPYKVQKVTEYGLNHTLGSTLNFIYEFMLTRIYDHKGRYHSYSFNERGNTIGVTNLTDEVNLKNAYGKGMVYEDAIYDKVIENNGIQYNIAKVNKAANSLQTEILPVKYTKNLITNSSFETWTESLNLTDETSRTGQYSLKINASNVLTYTLEANKTYTFSGYFKSSNKINVRAETNPDASSPYYLYEGTIPASNEFERFAFTFTLPENKTLFTFYMNVENYGVAYLDDVQIEEGEVANYYNLLPNGNFSNGLAGWNLNGDSSDQIITLSDGTKALKIIPKPGIEKSLTTSVKMHGEQTTTESGIGDVYYLSFWYKNTGLNKTSSLMMGGTGISTLINFDYPEEYEFPSCAIPLDIIPNNDEWQFYSVPFYSDSAGSYDNIYFTLFVTDNVNEFYITNISLTKDVSQHYRFHNPETGNTTGNRNADGTSSAFTYDKNNQLTSMFNPKGNNFKFEYDNTISNRLLKGVSPTGISNEIIYDTNGNPIRTYINNVNPDQNIINNKKYSIRLKGTNKYLDCDFIQNIVYFKENECSHDMFTFVQVGDYYRIKIGRLYLTYHNFTISLTTELSDRSLFRLSRNDNYSYCVSPKDSNLNIAYSNNGIALISQNIDDYNQQFYFEDVDTTLFMESKAECTTDGKFITKTIDALDKVTEYDINSNNGLTNSVTDSKGNTINYTYNDKEQITKVTKHNKEVNYTYNNQNLLSNIASGNKNYQFDYDDFLNPSHIKINNHTLITNTYEERNGNLIASTYGNGHTVNYTYDELDRIKTITRGNLTYTNVYDNVGNLAMVKTPYAYDYHYYYDLGNRIVKCSLDNRVFDESYSIKYDYDKNGNINQKIYTTPNRSCKVNFEYNQDDAVTKVAFDNNYLNYHYDYLGRLISKDINSNNNVEYTYISKGNQTSTIVQSMKIGNDLYKYSYDDLYNITDIYLDTNLIHHYEYDNFNELVLEDNYVLNRTFRYVYDNEGNILRKNEYEINTYNLIHTDKYEYHNSDWEDQLTKYNNEEITYDAIGNPLTIGSKTLTWVNGRQLERIIDSNTNLNAFYIYNKDGTRRMKNINGTITNYFTENNKIIFEQTGNDVIYYIRDEEGNLIGFKYDNTMYYYIKNMQDDIIGIIDSNYNKLVEYTYDSWGKLISIKDNNGDIITDTSHIGYINPYRYRSYYYDNETGYYYLNSRYYNPVWGRFINVDIGISKYSVDGLNMYQYALNNPLNLNDSDGYWPKWLKKVAIGVGVIAVCAVAVAITGGAGAGVVGYVAAGALKGAVIGSITGAAIGATTSIVKNRIDTGSWNGLGKAALNGATNGFASGAISGAITGTISSSVKVYQASKSWSAGGTYKSGFDSMTNHYKRQVVKKGFSDNNNIVKYTNDALDFAERNFNVLQYTEPSRSTMIPGFKSPYMDGVQNGWYTSDGKILTFWYK